MPKRATDGTCSAGSATLAQLLGMAVPQLQEAQRRAAPRTGPGRPPIYADWQVAAMIMLAVLKKKKSKSAQYRFLHENQAHILPPLGLARLISRSDYFERYRQAHHLFVAAVQGQGRTALAEHAANAKAVAADKSLVRARGPKWDQRDRKRGVVPKGLRGVDREAAWGYSEYDEWVYGFSYEVIVSATADDDAFPLLVSTGTASTSEHKTLAAKIPHLPACTRYVLADSGYDSDPAGEAIEYEPDPRSRCGRGGNRNRTGGRGRDRAGRGQRRTGRRFICPSQPRAHGPTPGATRQRGAREVARQRRWERHRFYKSRSGRALYARRRQSVERFNAQFKQLFELEDRVWHRGLDNNATMLTCAVFCFQLLVRYNRRTRAKNACIQWILDAL